MQAQKKWRFDRAKPSVVGPCCSVFDRFLTAGDRIEVDLFDSHRLGQHLQLSSILLIISTMTTNLFAADRLKGMIAFSTASHLIRATGFVAEDVAKPSVGNDESVTAIAEHRSISPIFNGEQRLSGIASHNHDVVSIVVDGDAPLTTIRQITFGAHQPQKGPTVVRDRLDVADVEPVVPSPAISVSPSVDRKHSILFRFHKTSNNIRGLYIGSAAGMKAYSAA